MLALLCALAPQRAHALDKQASAHGGQLSGTDSGFAISGSVAAGVAVFNPTFAARPDNSGHALARLAPHLDVDLIGSRLSIPIDLNFFSDRDRHGLGKLAPSEFDVLSGLTSTWPIGDEALELGARFEHDMPVDRGSYAQSYVDTRAQLLFSFSRWDEAWHERMNGGDITGYVTLGLFAYNPTYAARPDNSGHALFRYVAHLNASTWNEHLFFGLDTTFFTDRARSPVAPSELDFTVEAGGRLDAWELHLAYERDMPIDRSHLVQHFVLLSVVYGFEVPTLSGARGINDLAEE